MTDDQERVPEPPLAPPSPQMADPTAELPSTEPPGYVAPPAEAGEPIPPSAPAEVPAAPPPAVPAPVAAAVAAGPATEVATPPPAGPTYTWEQPTETSGPAPGVRFAGHPGRLMAYIIDGIIVGVVTTVLFLVSLVFLMAGANVSEEDVTLSPGGGIGFLVMIVIIIVVSLGYFPFFWARSGSTPGMRVFGLKVVRDRDGGPVTAGQAIIRLIGYYISYAVIYLGFAWILIDSRRRGWHDLLAGTCVIQRER